jgi:hypothetical protein
MKYNNPDADIIIPDAAVSLASVIKKIAREFGVSGGDVVSLMEEFRLY